MMAMTHCQDHILTENIWFVWSKTPYSGYEWQPTNQPTGRLSFVIMRQTQSNRLSQTLSRTRLLLPPNTIPDTKPETLLTVLTHYSQIASHSHFFPYFNKNKMFIFQQIYWHFAQNNMLMLVIIRYVKNKCTIILHISQNADNLNWFIFTYFYISILPLN